MTSKRQRATKGKRAVVFLAAALCIGMGVLMGFVPDGDSFFRHYGKWVLCAILSIGGIWILIIALRGERRQIDQAVDQIGSGLMGGP